MENKKEIKKKILNMMGEELSKYGFGKKAHGYSFWKPIDDGNRAMIHIAFIDHYVDFDMTVSVSIRIEIVENMVNSANNMLTKKEASDTSTIGIELGNLVEGRPKRYSVDDYTNLDDVISEMMVSIKERAFPFIEKYSDLENVMEVMLSDDIKVWLLSPFHHRRAQNAVALAKLLRVNELESIIKKQRDFLESRNDSGLKWFNNFVDKLMMEQQEQTE